MRAIWKRELQAMFFTPVGYTFMGFFLLVSGYFFWGYNILNGSSSMSSYFERLTYLLVAFIPVITMRLFSEERKNRTEQLLLTAPIAVWRIVAGKFFAAATVFLLTVLATGIYPGVILCFGRLNIGMTLTNYLGFYLLGLVYIAIGELVSVLCENQVSAVIATLVINAMLQVIEFLPQMLPNGMLFRLIGRCVGWLSLSQRNLEFASGLLKLSNVLYFLSFTAVLLMVVTVLIERRQRSED